eukprot:15442291-Alexandrium_andersonii.AAC.1
MAGLSRAPMAKDCAECRAADCGSECAIVRFSHLRTPSSPAFLGRFGICTNNGAERTSRERREP